VAPLFWPITLYFASVRLRSSAMRVSVCLSACEHISELSRPNITKFSRYWQTVSPSKFAAGPKHFCELQPTYLTTTVKQHVAHQTRQAYTLLSSLTTALASQISLRFVGKFDKNETSPQKLHKISTTGGNDVYNEFIITYLVVQIFMFVLMRENDE